MGGKPHVLIGEAEVVAHLEKDDARDRIELAFARLGSLLSRCTSRTGTATVRSTSPDWIAATRADGSLMISKVTRRILGFGPQ